MKRSTAFAHSTSLSLALALALALPACSGGDEPASSPTPAPAPQPKPAAAKPPKPAAEAATPDSKQGAVLYATFCAVCHGAGGGGDGALAASLNPRPAAHNDRAIMDAMTDEDLFKVIKLGGTAVGKSAAMAPWGGTLTDPQIRDVIAFMRTLPD